MDNVCDVCRWYETDADLQLVGMCINVDSPEFRATVDWDHGCRVYGKGHPAETFEMPPERMAVMEAYR